MAVCNIRLSLCIYIMKEALRSLEDFVDVLIDKGIKLAEKYLFDVLLDLEKILFSLPSPLPHLTLGPEQSDLIVLAEIEAVEKIHALAKLPEAILSAGALFILAASEVGIGDEPELVFQF